MRKKLILAIISMMIFFSMCGFKSNEDKIIDDADILTDTQEDLLQEKCIEMANEYELDIVVVTTNRLGGYEDWEYALRIFKANEFGYEEDLNDPSGLVFMISLDPSYRSVGMFSFGIANAYYPDTESADSVIDAGYNECKSGQYYNAFYNMMNRACVELEDFEFAAGTEDVIEAWYDGEYANSETFYEDYEKHSNRAFKNIVAVVVCVLIAAAIGGLTVLTLNSKYKNVMTAHGGTYFEENSFRMHDKQDNFIRTDVSRVRIESSSGGSGGRSSGGSRVGGGSRRF